MYVNQFYIQRSTHHLRISQSLIVLPILSKPLHPNKPISSEINLKILAPSLLFIPQFYIKSHNI